MPVFEISPFTPSELLHSVKYGKIYLLTEINGIYVIRLGKTSHEEFQQLYQVVLQKISEKKAESFTIDFSHSEPSSVEDRSWLLMKWFPELIKTVGKRHFKIAGVTGTNPGHIKFIIAYLEKTIEEMNWFPVKSFTFTEEAITWLRGNL
jgi:hypothetical protein